MTKIRILLIRIDRIGDVVLTTAIPREIKNKFPDAFIAVMVRSYTKDIFINNPYVDEVIIADEYINCEKPEVLKYAAKLRNYKFTHSFLILPNEKLNYIIFLSGIKNRFGTGHKLYQFITGVKGLSRNKYNPLRHEADYCMDFARAIGVTTSNIDSEIYLSVIEKEKSKKLNLLLKKDNLSKKIIGIHTTSGNSAPNFIIKEYSILLNELLNEPDYIVCITDNKVPKELDNIDNVVYLNRNNNLRDTIVNLSAIDLLVCASTGPLHIAAALKIKSVSLFCPLTACSPKLWGPVGNKSIELIPDANYCAGNCPNDPKKCKYENGGIKIDTILQSINKLLMN